MLFGPERNKRLRNPDADGGQAMKAGMAGGAQSNEQLRFVGSRPPVMHHQETRLPARLAEVPIAGENLLAR